MESLREINQWVLKFTKKWIDPFVAYSADFSLKHRLYQLAHIIIHQVKQIIILKPKGVPERTDLKGVSNAIYCNQWSNFRHRDIYITCMFSILYRTNPITKSKKGSNCWRKSLVLLLFDECMSHVRALNGLKTNAWKPSRTKIIRIREKYNKMEKDN